MCNTSLHRHFTTFAIALVALVLSVAVQSITRAQSIATSASTLATQDRPWTNPDNSVDERVSALLKQMTLEEKIGQLTQANATDGEITGTNDNRAEGDSLSKRVRRGQLGSVLNAVEPTSINALQRVVVKESRLGIPLIFGRDVIHGFRTIFPIPLGQAASWNPDLAEKAAAIAAREARSGGAQWPFAPMVKIARAPRGGRIAESLGED